jgi:hypothetical protein
MTARALKEGGSVEFTQTPGSTGVVVRVLFPFQGDTNQPAIPDERDERG